MFEKFFGGRKETIGGQRPQENADWRKENITPGFPKLAGSLEKNNQIVLPEKILQGKKEYRKRADNTYESSDGSIIPSLVALQLLFGSENSSSGETEVSSGDMDSVGTDSSDFSDSTD